VLLKFIDEVQVYIEVELDYSVIMKSHFTIKKVIFHKYFNYIYIHDVARRVSLRLTCGARSLCHCLVPYLRTHCRIYLFFNFVNIRNFFILKSVI
jgi:hypothetical protein